VWNIQYVFSDGPTVEYDTYVPPFGKVNGVAQEEPTTEESSDNPNYLSVLLGVSFPLGK